MTSDINPTMRASVDSGGDQTVSSGMIVSRGVFLSNTSQTMLFGGVADFAVVSSGLQDVFGVANGTLVTGVGPCRLPSRKARSSSRLVVSRRA